MYMRLSVNREIVQIMNSLIVNVVPVDDVVITVPDYVMTVLGYLQMRW